MINKSFVDNVMNEQFFPWCIDQICSWLVFSFIILTLFCTKPLILGRLIYSFQQSFTTSLTQMILNLCRVSNPKLHYLFFLFLSRNREYLEEIERLKYDDYISTSYCSQPVEQVALLLLCHRLSSFLGICIAAEHCLHSPQSLIDT